MKDSPVPDMYDKIESESTGLGRLLSKIPGFDGYVERQNRRAADKLIRETIADHFEVLYKRISSLQTDFISQGEISYLDDLERAAIKLRTFIDKIRRASYGYSGFFDAVKINEEELARVYEYEAGLLDLEDEVNHAIDNVESSMGTDGLPAAIRHLTSKAQDCLDAFNRRDELMQQG